MKRARCSRWMVSGVSKTLGKHAEWFSAVFAHFIHPIKHFSFKKRVFCEVIEFFVFVAFATRRADTPNQIVSRTVGLGVGRRGK